MTFSDPTPQFTRAQVDAVLQNVQDQSALLEYLEKDMARSKEYLSKAVKGRGDDLGMGFQGPDEDIFAHMGPGPGGAMWADD